MTAILQGVRILEVAEHTFVPAASALLADWGAEVIKIEHVERGDAMRGLASTRHRRGPERRARPARALQPGQEEPGARPHLRTTGSTSSTSWPPPATSSSPTSCPACARSSTSTSTTSGPHNPNIIYVRGTGQGERGPDADKGSYDSLAFWARSGVAMGAMRPEYDLRAGAARPGLRRLDRRHDHRRRDHGRAVPPRAHRRGHHRRRLAARRRPVGHGPGDRRCRSCSTSRGGRRRPRSIAAQPAVAQLRDRGRPRRSSFTCLQAGKYWAAALRGHRPARAGHRPALRRPRRR